FLPMPTCPCCSGSLRLKRVSTVKMGVSSNEEDEIVEEPRIIQIPAIKKVAFRIWPSFTNLKNFIAESRFLLTNDKIFEFTACMMIVCLVTFFRDCYLCRGSAMLPFFLYNFFRFLVSFHLFAGHGWMFQTLEYPVHRTGKHFRLSIVISVASLIIIKILSLFYGASQRSIISELVVVLIATMGLSFDWNESKLYNRQLIKSNDEVAILRRRVISEFRARSEGVYYPVLADSKGERRERKMNRRKALNQDWKIDVHYY
ncbi:hypothetical protein PFISCL1PPCAC_6590, partial [Pristionchus fissidentatus]